MCAEKSLISLVGSATWSPRSSPLLKAFGSVTGASEVPGPPCRESRRLGNGGGGINSEYSRRWSCRDGPQLLQQLAGTRPIVNLALFFFGWWGQRGKACRVSALRAGSQAYPSLSPAFGAATRRDPGSGPASSAPSPSGWRSPRLLRVAPSAGGVREWRKGVRGSPAPQAPYNRP